MTAQPNPKPPILATTVQIPMPDGIALTADVYRLTGQDGPRPVLLAMTPYGRVGLGGFMAPAFVPHGYVLVAVDVRGRYDSPGTFAPIIQERKDAPAVVDWIAAQPWLDREAGIGVIGLSYLATAGIIAAASRPLVKAVSCITIVVDPLESFFRGGVLDLHHAFPWSLITGFSPQPDLRRWDWDTLFGHVPLATMHRAAGVDLPVWQRTVVEAYDDPALLREMCIGEDIAQCKAPMLHMAGWYDFILGESLRAWDIANSAHNAPHAMVIGPWSHTTIMTGETALSGHDFGPESSSRLPERLLDWFDRWLRPGVEGGGEDSGRVQAFVTGAGGGWRTLDSWPPAEAPVVRLSLSGAPADLEGLEVSRSGVPYRGNGIYTLSDTTANDGWLVYDYDPTNPVPTMGGAVWPFAAAGLNAGPQDQRALAGRTDGLLFLSPPLERDMEVLGPLGVHLVAATNAPDTDFAARLFDVTTEGPWQLIQDGIQRARFRCGWGTASRVEHLLEPSQHFTLDIDLWAAGHRFTRGHRIGLHIASSNFPKYARNLNTGGHPLWEDAFRDASQRIRMGASYLKLTIAE